MSHRIFDEMSRLRTRLDAIEVDIAAARARPLVDFYELKDLRATRDTLLAQIAAKEEAARS